MFTGVFGERAKQALAGTRFADVRGIEVTGSTNDDLLQRARQADPEGIVLVADRQTAGRGRRDRTWSARAPHALLMSVLFRPLPEVPTHVPMVALAVSTAEVAIKRGGAVALKWPNDVIRAGAGEQPKIAGLLGETVVSGGRVEAVVVGMGLNLTSDPDWPAAVAARASGLDAVGVVAEREELTVEILTRLDRWYGRVIDGDLAALRDRWRQLSATIGRLVRIELATGELRGRATDVDIDHTLMVEDGARTHRVSVGDVVHLR